MAQAATAARAEQPPGQEPFGTITCTVPNVTIITPLAHEATKLAAVLRPYGLSPIISGPGPAAVTACVQAQLADPEGAPKLIILAGLAGGLKPAGPLPPCGWGTMIFGPKNAKVRGRAKSLVACTWPAVRISSVEQALCLPEQKRELSGENDADFVDTESYWFAQKCADNDVPWAVIRAVSDDRDEILPPAVLRWTLPNGQTDYGRVLKDMLRHPSLIQKSLKLGKKAKSAMRLISDELARVLPHLATKVKR